MCHTGHGHHNAPACDQNANVVAGPGELREYDVRRCFAKDVGYKEDHQCYIVVVARHTQAGLQASVMLVSNGSSRSPSSVLEFGVSNIGSVEMCNEIE